MLFTVIVFQNCKPEFAEAVSICFPVTHRGPTSKHAQRLEPHLPQTFLTICKEPLCMLGLGDQG